MKWHSMHYGNRSSLITNSDYDETIIGNICVRVCVYVYGMEGVLHHRCCKPLGLQSLPYLRLSLPWRSVRAAKKLI